MLDISTGNRLKSINYTPRGQIYSANGSLATTEFGFAGMHNFPFMTNGPLLTKYRVYDPALGRWWSRDPIAENGGINLYGYVGGNFVNYTDRSGLFLDEAAYQSAVDITATAAKVATSTASAALAAVTGVLYSPPAGKGSDSPPCDSCKSKHPEYVQCSVLDRHGYDFNSKQSALNFFGRGMKTHSEQPLYEGPCAGTPDALHWNVRGQKGSGRVGSVTSCTCCEDTPNGPILRNRFMVY
jgi:RHS repeat-associated protein